MNRNGPSETTKLNGQYEDSQKVGESPSGEAQGSEMDYKFFYTALIGVFLAFADDTFVFTTHGTIASDFGDTSMGSWLVTAYNLGFAVSLPIYGRVCDIYGYEYPLQAAYLLFTTGCLMSGFAGSLWVAIAGRLLSGAGGSGMTDLLIVIVNDKVSPRAATVLRSYVSMVMTVAVSVGAPLGGALTEWVGWRWAFLVQVPISILCLVMAIWRLRTTNKKQDYDYEQQSRADLNLRGIALLGLSIISLMMIAQALGELRTQSFIELPLLSTLFIGSLALFCINERCWTSTPLVPLQLIKSNGIGAMYLAQLILFFSYGGICSHITEFWIRTENYANSLAAATVLPVIFGNIISAGICSRIVQRTGRYKKLLIAGCIIAMASNILLAVRWPHRPLFWEMVFYVALGLGVGGILVCTFTGLSVSVPSQMTATAMTNYYLCQQLGMVVGVSVASAATRGLFESYLAREIPQSEDKSQLVAHIINDLRFSFTLSEPIQSIARHCFLRSFQVIPAISGGSLVLALFIFFKLPEKSLD